MSEQLCLLSLVYGKPSLTVFKDIMNYEQDDISTKIVDLLDLCEIPKLWRRCLENSDYGVISILKFNLSFSEYINSLGLEDGFLTLDLYPTLSCLREGVQFEFQL